MNVVCRLPSEDWLQQLRQRGWEVYSTRELPSRREEEWMRTDIRTFQLDHYGIPAAVDVAKPAPFALTHGVELAGSVSTVNSCLNSASLDPHWQQRGVVFGSLPDLLKGQGDLIRQYLFQRAIKSNLDQFAALHAACWTSGTFMYVPRGLHVDRPFHSHATLTGEGVDLGHTLVVLDEGAEDNKKASCKYGIRIKDESWRKCCNNKR